MPLARPPMPIKRAIPVISTTNTAFPAADFRGSARGGFCMATAPLMPKATAVWLVDNTSLTFEQIAAFLPPAPARGEGHRRRRRRAGHQGHGPDARRPAGARGDREGRGRPELPHEDLRAEGAGAGDQAARAALHAGLEAAGPAERHSLAGAQPSGAEGRADHAPRRHHQADHPGDPRAHALELGDAARRPTR